MFMANVTVRLLILLNKRSKRMKLGISTCTYTWNFGRNGYPLCDNPFNVDTLLEEAKAHNITVVQILENIIPLNAMSRDELVRIGNKANSYGISLEIGTLGITPRILSVYLEIANIMGASLVRTIMDGDGAHPSVEEGAKWINSVLPEYKKQDVKIAIENHDLRKCQELATLVKCVNDPNVGICLDMVNSLGAQECQSQVVECLLPYIINVHYKDFQIKRTDYDMGFIVNGCIAGTGMTDMDYIVNNRDKALSDFNIILEQWMPLLSTVQDTANEERRWADESINYLKQHYSKYWD